MTITRLLLAAAMLLLIGATTFVGGSSGPTEAKQADSPSVTFEFSASFDERQDAFGVTQIVLQAANIGSSGEDGVRAGSDFVVDSFFDIDYQLTYGDPDTGSPTASTVDIEIVALSLTSADPTPAIDSVRDALGKLPGLTRFRGHVTVLK